jgi:hypothetical protein
MKSCCCGQNRHVPIQIQDANRRAVFIASGTLSPGKRRAVPRMRVGDNCVYCGTMVIEKIKKTTMGWIKAGWCPKCCLEV